jgi:hypothetical protein
MVYLSAASKAPTPYTLQLPHYPYQTKRQRDFEERFYKEILENLALEQKIKSMETSNIFIQYKREVLAKTRLTRVKALFWAELHDKPARYNIVDVVQCTPLECRKSLVKSDVRFNCLKSVYIPFDNKEARDTFVAKVNQLQIRTF